MIPTVWIKRAGAAEHNKKMERRLEARGVPSLTVEAVNTQTIDKQSLRFTNFKCNTNTLDELCRTASHLKAISLAYIAGHSVAVILESHMCILHYPSDSDLAKAPTDWGILQLYMTGGLADVAYESRPAHWVPHIWGYFEPCAYVINRVAMLKLLSTFSPYLLRSDPNSLVEGEYDFAGAPMPYNKMYYMLACVGHHLLFESVTTYASTDIWFYAESVRVSEDSHDIEWVNRLLERRKREQKSNDIPLTCPLPCIQLTQQLQKKRAAKVLLRKVPIYVMNLVNNMDRRDYMKTAISALGCARRTRYIHQRHDSDVGGHFGAETGWHDSPISSSGGAKNGIHTRRNRTLLHVLFNPYYCLPEWRRNLFYDGRRRSFARQLL